MVVVGRIHRLTGGRADVAPLGPGVFFIDTALDLGQYPDQLAPFKYQDTIFTTTAINTTPPAGDVVVEKPIAPTAGACSCNEDPAGENRNWMLLIVGALLVYLLTNSKK